MACDPFADKKLALALDVRLVELEELLREADFLSLHAPYGRDATWSTRIFFPA